VNITSKTKKLKIRSKNEGETGINDMLNYMVGDMVSDTLRDRAGVLGG
jgi:hypothetical protein